MIEYNKNILKKDNTFRQFNSLFKSSSITYYYASVFFPQNVKSDVFTLYAFVRTADNLVDSIPQDEEGFYSFKKQTLKAMTGSGSDNGIISRFVDMAKKNDISTDIVTAFLQSMEADISKSTYNTFAELEEYMHGSAEVIGIMMMKILDLPEESIEQAKAQGKAMQLINFIRDINEDIQLERQYMPQEDLDRFSITRLDSSIASTEEFVSFIRFEIDRYYSIQKKAEEGYKHIPKHYLIPIKTASDMYNWTAKRLYTNPSIIFETKVKPKPWRVVGTIITNSIFL